MIFESLLNPVLSIIDKVIPDQKARDEAKIKLLELETSGQLQFAQEQSKVITAEIQGESVLARNWRPTLMYLFIAIIFNNYILCPILATFNIVYVTLDIPEKMWSLLEIGLGGYIFGRSAEKAIKEWKK